MAQIERTTIQQRRVSEIFMKAVFRNAPAGVLEMYHSVLAAGPKGNRSQVFQNRQALIQQTQAELLELNQQLSVLRICIEQDERMSSF
ncbi:hypothetical protein [Paenibacillus graminis]|uniref:hypothetical protein n=1 Tax=Paenibacillus graminis TaxID=189425 RepID=UPI002DB7C861|nr:hypothetical protein [Paenibacillus graminis]MEC0172565.1 hypothetical protein [Paenibacillus graminis]